MSGMVDLQFSASDRAAQQAWVSQQRLADKLIAKLEKLEQVSKKAGGGLKFPSLGGVTGQLTTMVASITSLATVIRQVRVEVEAILQERTGAAYEQVQYRRAVGNAFRNSGNLFKSPQDLDRYIADTSRVTNQSRTKVAQLIDSGLSAQGATTPEDLANVKETMIETLKTYPEVSVEETKVLLQAAQDIRSKNPGMTAREAVGFNLKMGQVARVVDPQTQATNLSPPTANLMSYDMPLQEAGALMAAGTHGMKDWTGEMTGTAMLTLAREMKERLPNLKTFGERLEAFRKHPEWVDAYFQGGMINGRKFDKAETGKGKAEPTIRALFDPNSLDSKRMEEFKAEIGTFESIGQFTAKHQADLRNLLGSLPEEVKRAAEAIKEDLRLENTRGAMGAVTDVALKDILSAAGVSDLDSERMLFGLRTSGVEPGQKPRELAQKLRTMEEDLRAQGQGEKRPDFTSSWYGSLIPAPIKWWFGDTPSGKEQLQRADMLGNAAGRFDELSEKYNSAPPAPRNYLDQYSRDEIENYRNRIKKGEGLNRQEQMGVQVPGSLRLSSDELEKSIRANRLIDELEGNLRDGLDSSEIPGLRGDLDYAASVVSRMKKNQSSFGMLDRIANVSSTLDAFDPGQSGMRSRLLDNGMSPENAREYLPRIEQARKGSQILPEAERQQKNQSSFGMLDRIANVSSTLDAFDPGQSGMRSRLLDNGMSPENAREYLPRIEQARKGSQILPEAERQQLQLQLDELQKAIQTLSESVERNTQSTDKNTTKGEGSPVAEPQTSRSRYSPVSTRLGRV